MENKQPTKWFHNQEEVKLERWIWGVVYQDGTELKQYDADGKFHQFKEIDQNKVRLFVMLNPETGKRFDLLKKEGMQLFHFYRICGTIDGEGRRENRVYVFGYKEKKHTAYHYILPNDTLLISSKDVNLENFGAFEK